MTTLETGATRHDLDRVVLFGVVEDVGASWTSIIRFTATGDVRIVSESIDHW